MEISAYNKSLCKRQKEANNERPPLIGFLDIFIIAHFSPVSTVTFLD